MSRYRLSLHKSLRKEKAILIVDGHKSRKNPIAIKMLQENNISLFVLPAHTSHVTQIFDLGIGSPMKKLFSKKFKLLMLNFNPENNQSAKLRGFFVDSAIWACEVKCNYKSCSKAAASTPTYPCNAEQLLRSHFVSVLSPKLQKIAKEKEKRRRKEKVNINCKLINDEILYLINEMILECRFHKHLSLDNYSEYNDETL